MAPRKKVTDAATGALNDELQKSKPVGDIVPSKAASEKMVKQAIPDSSADGVGADTASEKPMPRKLGTIAALKSIADEAFREDIEQGGRILSIDGSLKAVTDTKKMDATVIELADSFRDRKPLTGVISQIEEAPNGNPYASLLYNDMIKIILPASDFLDLDKEALAETERERYHVEKLLLFKRLNSEIDFIVANQVDIQNRIAAASRRAAMRQKQHTYWLTPDRDGNYIIQEGMRVEARIVSVNQRSLTAEIFGVESQIPVEEVSNDFIQSLADHSEYHAGRTIPVKIMSIDRSDPNDIHVSASIKMVNNSKWLDKIVDELDKGHIQRVVGVVESASVYGIFVRLFNGVQCLCHAPASGRYPMKDDKVTVKIDRVDRGSMHVYGSITHVL